MALKELVNTKRWTSECKLLLAGRSTFSNAVFPPRLIEIQFISCIHETRNFQECLVLFIHQYKKKENTDSHVNLYAQYAKLKRKYHTLNEFSRNNPA